MTNKEAIEILNDELEMWARALGKIKHGSEWFEEILSKVHALRIAIAALQHEEEKCHYGEEKQERLI